MFATALALALGVATASAQAPLAPPRSDEPTPNFYRQLERCGPLHAQITRRENASLRGRERGLQYAVLRTVAGCALRSPVGYHPDYLLPGHADAPEFRPVDDQVAPQP